MHGTSSLGVDLLDVPGTDRLIPESIQTQSELRRSLGASVAGDLAVPVILPHRD